MTTDDRRQEAQLAAVEKFPPRIGNLIRRRIVSLRIAAGPSERLNAELDGLCEEVLAAPDAPSRGAGSTTTEYGTVMSGGGVHVRTNDPEVDRIFPLADWIKAQREIQRAHVVRRRVVVIEDWEEVNAP